MRSISELLFAARRLPDGDKLRITTAEGKYIMRGLFCDDAMTDIGKIRLADHAVEICDTQALRVQ